MKKKFTADRRNQLAQIIISQGHITVSEASKKFNVSTETIRKDLIYLEKEGVAKKSHGGAIPASEVLEKPIFQKQTENAEIKNKIALQALNYVPHQGSIILDSGTTTLALAKLLKLESGLTIFTNSSAAFHELAESDNNVYIFGGLVRSSSLAVVGQWANEQIRAINVDIAFIGTDGFKHFEGPATMSLEEAEIKSNMLRASNKSVVLTDSSKFDSASLFQFGSWDTIDILITDNVTSQLNFEQVSKDTKVVLV